MFGDNDKIEMIGNANRTGNLKGGASVRQVANGAIDCAAAELDRSGLQDPMPRRNAVLVGCDHEAEIRAKAFPKPNHGSKRFIFFPAALR
jgi:hypothetical protein